MQLGERQTDNRTDKLTLSEVMNGLKEDVGVLKEDIIIIKSFLISTQPSTANLFSIKNSPRQLNENGQKLYDILDGDIFLNNNSDIFFSKLNAKTFLTALDVEMGVKEVLFELIEEPFFSPIKNIVYNSPSIELLSKDGNAELYEFTLNDAIFVLGIKLRNMYLATRPDITKDD